FGREIDGLEGELVGTIHVPEFYFYYALTISAVLKDHLPAARLKMMLRRRACSGKIRTWARYSPENFLHKKLFISAEKARAAGHYDAADALYDTAIAEAERSHYGNICAVACERAATLCISRGNTAKARDLLLRAYRGFLSWGYESKAGRMKDDVYADIMRENSTAPANADTSTWHRPTVQGGGSDVLDLSTVLKASQAISGEIVLGKLLEKLITILIENAGAQKGMLVLESGQELKIEARYSAESGELSVLESVPVKEGKELSAAVVNYVSRTKESLILNDAAEDERFSMDEYIRQTRPKSILCVPILNHGALSGILYLENNLAVNAFTQERITLLSMLSSQAAISIDNARLYANMENKVKERTAELNTANEFLLDVNRKLKSAQDIAEKDMKMAKNVQTSMFPKNAPQSQ
ncbi:MAG: GAF domain-containing protein, partial [Spirochaetota bacterium]